MKKEQKTDELVAKILQILSWQQVITNQGTNYTGEKDWALNQILNLISQEKEKMIEKIVGYENEIIKNGHSDANIAAIINLLQK